LEPPIAIVAEPPISRITSTLQVDIGLLSARITNPENGFQLPMQVEDIRVTGAHPHC